MLGPTEFTKYTNTRIPFHDQCCRSRLTTGCGLSRALSTRNFRVFAILFLAKLAPLLSGRARAHEFSNSLVNVDTLPLLRIPLRHFSCSSAKTYFRALRLAKAAQTVFEPRRPKALRREKTSHAHMTHPTSSLHIPLETDASWAARSPGWAGQMFLFRAAGWAVPLVILLPHLGLSPILIDLRSRGEPNVPTPKAVNAMYCHNKRGRVS